MVRILARKICVRAVLLLSALAVLALMVAGLYYSLRLFESSAYDVVAVFMVLIAGSNVLAHITGSFLDA